MQKFDFNEAVEMVLAEDARYAPAAYHFLREALDFTIKQLKKAKEPSKHVSGPQLLNGIRLYALREFGPMVPTVFEYWGITQCEDFGKMVFNLIQVGVFGKNDTDKIEDFYGVYSFEDAFVRPFQPGPVAAVPAPIAKLGWEEGSASAEPASGEKL
jgi:uncharacterized repeat protein (TIGR04138 family)